MIVGIYLGDCVTTAIVCSIGAESSAKRVGVVNILFNLSETVLVLLGVAVVHRLGLLDGLWDRPVNSGIIANTNTVFNLTCAICLLPMLGVYETASRKIIKDTPHPAEKYQDQLEGLNPVFFDTPALALRGCYNMLMAIFTASRENLQKAFRLLEKFDDGLYQEILKEEGEIDRMTDHLSRYTMELLPHLQMEYHVTILDQYYKVTSEFERLGDHAVHIAENAENLARQRVSYTEDAMKEIQVLEDAIDRILALTEQSFKKRSLDAAYEIEPRVQVLDEMITLLQKRQLERMRQGLCGNRANASFTSLMMEMKRIASACSNVGVSTVVRVHPKLATHEHQYYEDLRSGNDEAYNAAYSAARAQYFPLLES